MGTLALRNFQDRFRVPWSLWRRRGGRWGHRLCRRRRRWVRKGSSPWGVVVEGQVIGERVIEGQIIEEQIIEEQILMEQALDKYQMMHWLDAITGQIVQKQMTLLAQVQVIQSALVHSQLILLHNPFHQLDRQLIQEASFDDEQAILFSLFRFPREFFLVRPMVELVPQSLVEVKVHQILAQFQLVIHCSFEHLEVSPHLFEVAPHWKLTQPLSCFPL